MIKDINHLNTKDVRSVSRTRNERRERIKDAFLMVGISAFLGLIFLAGMNFMLAFEAAAW